MFYRGNVQRRKLLRPHSHKKKKPLAHPEWDNTIQDLTVHAASPEERLRRQIRRKSKNADIARREMMAKKRGIPVDLMLSPNQVEMEMKKLAILREVLYDHNDLNEVLRKTDETMSSVKNLFHDSIMRKSGRPNITLAPGKRQPPVPTETEHPSKLDALSDSVMDNKALNEESSSEESEYEDDVQFESKVDSERFLSLLKDSMNKVPKKITGDLPSTPEKAPSVNKQQALNCTEEVKRTLSRISSIKEEEEEETKVQEQTKKIEEVLSGISKDTSKLQRKLNNSKTTTVVSVKPMPSHNQCTMSYEGLQGAMEHVDKQIREFEKRTGRKRDEERSSSVFGLEGFTVTLIDSVARLTTFVNEGEIRTQVLEKSVEELTDKLEKQVTVNEALALELVNTQKVIKHGQEELAALKEDVKKERERKEQEKGEMQNRIEQLSKTVKEFEKKFVITENTLVEDDDVINADDIEIVQENGRSVHQQDHASSSSSMHHDMHMKEQQELALKNDMVKLLTALKAQNEKVTSRRSPDPVPVIMNNTQEAAKTIASVESHLRHLQLQHDEAQQRMDELTKQAQLYSFMSQHQLIGVNGDGSPSTDSSKTSLISLPVKTASEPAKKTILQSNIAGHSKTLMTNNCPYRSQVPVQPITLPANVDFPDFESDVGSFKFLEEDVSTAESSVLSSPHIAEQQQVVLHSIQQTQMSLEDRISELNMQHNKAQERLQKLVARRKSSQDQVPTKRIQVSLPSDDMLQTPARSQHSYENNC